MKFCHRTRKIWGRLLKTLIHTVIRCDLETKASSKLYATHLLFSQSFVIVNSLETMFKFKWQPLPEWEAGPTDSPAPLYRALIKRLAQRTGTHTALIHSHKTSENAHAGG